LNEGLNEKVNEKVNEHVSQPKVFEFAKEIGMETLALMDKIREWKLPVRSHMAELAPEMVEQIKAKLSEGPSTKASDAKKKKVAKKAAPAGPAAKANGAAKKPPPAAKPENKPGNRKAAEEQAAAALRAAGATAAGRVVVKKAPPKTVVRRKHDEIAEDASETAEATETPEAADAGDRAHEGELARASLDAASAEIAPASASEAEYEDERLLPAAEDVAHAGTHHGVAAASVAHAPAVEPATPPAVPHIAAPEPASPASAAHAPHASHSLNVVTHPAAHAANLSAHAPHLTPSHPAPGLSSGAAAGGAHAVAAAGTHPAPVADGAPSGPTPGRKREVVMTAGASSGIRSEPRRNIVGRMDLSRVQAPQGSGRPGGIGIGGPSPRIGGGPGAPGPRGLRPGFVSAAPVDLPGSDADSERRRFEDRTRKRPGAPGAAPAANQKEQEVAAFAATEFRKREMVFQPKKKKGMLNRASKQTQITTPKASKRVVKVDERMKVSDLAEALGVKAAQVVKKLMVSGVTATMNTVLDFDTISLIAPEFEHEAVNVHRTVDQLIEATAFGELDAQRQPRPPVVTIMGHVDHGKTSLLDAIRKADVASGEAGGITQHIGAYRVTTEDGHIITFLDTPGHEAFTAMRARGANVTDIAVIVVAADDGVMPQTAEAINHAKAAGVPIIVAVNKIDKPGANPDKIKQQLTEFQLVPEEWGGDTIFVNTSAAQKTGIKELLEQIYLLAEMEELTGNAGRSATGAVIEARVDKGRGPVATLLIQDGTLRIGQPIVVGAVAGRVRMLINDKGERVQEAGPSTPVEVLGLSEAPMAGDRFDSCETEKDAEEIAQARKQSKEQAAPVPAAKMSLEDLFSKVKMGETKELALVLKSDVAGSSEAIKGMFEKLGTSEVKIKIIHAAVGGINESDVLLASTAKGIVVGFNVRPDGGAQQMAKREGVEIKTYTIVYELVDDMKKAMSGLLAPEIKEQSQGRAEVRNIFSVPKLGTIAGCAVVDGKIARNSQVRLVRDGKIVYTGKLASLKRFKDDAKEVAAGYECGVGIENFNDIKVGDVIEAFTQETISREI
jgi:translation initiation factor IF-2